MFESSPPSRIGWNEGYGALRAVDALWNRFDFCSGPSPMPEVNSNSHHPKGSRFLAAVFASLAAIFILPVVETGYTELGGRDPLFEPVGGMSMGDGVIVSGSYELYALGRVVLTRSNLTPQQYKVETILLVIIPVAILIASGGVLGWFAGRVVAYRLLHPRPRL